MPSRVLAIVVCYKPQISALKVALEALQGQVDATLLVDNASANIDEIAALVDDHHSLELLRQSDNLGLGAAHNIGIEYARQHAFDYLLLLDQDSVPLDGMVQNLLTAQRAKSKQDVSAVGATYLNADNGSESFFVRFGKFKFRRYSCSQHDQDNCIQADFLISSGSLIKLSAIEQIGEMDESLFIDHVDTEWFLRAKSKGFQAYGVCNAVMQHGLGEQTHQLNLGRQRNVPQHKPFRYYYIFRNSVALYRRSYASGWWKWNDLQRLLLISIMFGLVKSPRRQNLKMMVKGVVDGLRGVSGKIEQ
jgi:rhamnosyltransferase